ncbi:MAG TPA: SAF domain-containing protein [Woeseiaceae bacterium]
MMLSFDIDMAKREASGNPVQVSLYGAGFMGHGIARQLVTGMPGIRLAVMCNRTIEKAVTAFTEAGVDRGQIVEATNAKEISEAIKNGKYVVTTNPEAAATADGLDVVMEGTGHVSYGTDVAIDAIAAGKDLLLMNAELDATIGPILKTKADQAGVIISGVDGDQPAVQMNLYRYVKVLGLDPVLCGNIKGLQDAKRTPTTQKGFAEKWGMSPEMVTSFADGTKISFEQAIVANATGMKVAKRGMYGYEHRAHIDSAVDLYDIDELQELGGIVDYVLGATPGPGCYVMAAAKNDSQKVWLDYGKLGSGPLYCFYTPQHLMAMEAALTIARVALQRDVVIAPLAGPVVDVITIAKRDLKAGETIDGLGGYMTYGTCENSEVARDENLLLMGLAEGARLKRDVAEDAPLTMDDVELPDSLPVKLRMQQDEMFNG